MTTPAFTDSKPSDEPDDYGTPPMVDLPPDLPPADSKPKGRPTTRAGRAAARKANSARTASADAKPKPTKAAPRKTPLEGRLAAAFASLGGMVTATGVVVGSEPVKCDGLVLIEHSANMAEAINRVADQDPRVKAALEKMLTAGVWSGVAACMLPVALGIGANHGLVPPGLAEILGLAKPEAAA